MATARILELLNAARRPRRRRRDPRALEGPLDRGGQPRPARPDLDADGGLRLYRRRHGRPLGGACRRDAVLHRAPDGVPRHPLRPRLHRHRPARRVRGGDRDGNAPGQVARSSSPPASGSSGGTRSSSPGIRWPASSRARWSTRISCCPAEPARRRRGENATGRGPALARCCPCVESTQSEGGDTEDNASNPVGCRGVTLAAWTSTSCSSGRRARLPPPSGRRRRR